MFGLGLIEAYGSDLLDPILKHCSRSLLGSDALCCVSSHSNMTTCVFYKWTLLIDMKELQRN